MPKVKDDNHFQVIFTVNPDAEPMNTYIILTIGVSVSTNSMIAPALLLDILQLTIIVLPMVFVPGLS